MSIYDFTVKTQDGAEVSLAGYKGKFLLDREGNIVARFEPTDMKNLKERIKECL